MKQTKIFAVSVLAVALSACGSSGGGGLTLDSGTIGGVISMSDSASAYGDIAKGMGGSGGAGLYGTSGGITKSSGGVTAQATGSYTCPAGGSIDYTTGTPTSLTYNQCTYSGGSISIIMNGSMSMNYTDSYNFNMSMPSFSFTVTGSQTFDMTISNYSITSAGNSSYYTLDYGMTIDASTLSGSFSIQTTSPLVYDAADAGSSYGFYPKAGTVHVSANGTADITYYSGGYTVTYSGGTVDCVNYVCTGF